MMKFAKVALQGATFLLAPSLALAAPITTPWIAPGGGISGSSKMLAPGSTLDGKTVTQWGSAIDLANTTATDAATDAIEVAEQLNSYVAIKSINAATSGGVTGVSGLDESGNAVSPVNTTGMVWGQSYVGAGYIAAGNGYTARPSFSSGWNNGDAFLYPNTTLIGGHTDHDDGYLKVIGSPWSMSDSGGAIAAIYDTIGDQGTGRNGCGNDDGCSLYVGTQITPFRVEAGVQVHRDDDVARNVTLTGNSVTISPALSDAQIRLLKTWMRIYTNYDASGGNATGGSYWTNWNGQTLTTATFTPNVYYGYISSWVQGTNTTVLNIVSDPDGRAAGWRTEASADTVTTAPGSNSGDIIDADSSSPTWTYTTPSVFIGGAYKKFNTNRTVACLPGTNTDTLSRECEGEEMDLWGGTTASGIRGRTVHGLTISYGGDEPADGSYDLDLAGGINNLLVMAPNWYATAVQSDPLYVGPMEGPSRDVSSGNTTSVIASLATSTNTGDQTFSNFTYIRPMWYAERFATDSNSTTDYTNETINYGVSVGAGRGELGTIQEHIAMNPKAYPNGIGLCGYNSCAYVNSQGVIISGGDIHTGSGSALYTIDPNGSNAAYAYSDANYQMNIAFNTQSGTSTAYSGAQGAKGLHLQGSLLADDNIVVADGKSIGLNNSSGTMGAYQYLVDATSTVGPILHQVVANTDGLAGTFYVDGAFTTGGAAQVASLDVVGAASVSGTLTAGGNITVADGKAVGLNNSSGIMGAYQWLQDGTSTAGPVLHQVVNTANGLAGTFYVDGALSTGGAAQLASLEVVNAATFDQGATIPSGKSYAVKSAAGTTYLTADATGNFEAVQGSPNVGGGFKDASFTLSDLPSAPASDGTHVWCSDCKLNSITGVEAYWHSSASKWTDSQNNTLAN